MLDDVRRLRDAARLRAGTLIIDGTLRGLATLGKLHPRSRKAHREVELLSDVPYLTDGAPEHLLDIYRPTRRHGPWPVMLYLHGGGFRILSKDTHWVFGLGFARRGFLVFVINYRLGPRHAFPAALEDAADALRWVRANAARHGGDPSRLVLAGESAGANLCTALALCCCYRRPEPLSEAVWASGILPRAVLPACGLLQVSDVQRFARRRRLPGWIRDRMENSSRAYIGNRQASDELELADPLVVLERGLPPDRPLPPFLAQVGTRDPLLDDTRRLARALQRLGVPCEARYYPGEVHAFHALVWRPQARKAWRHAYGFLDRHVQQHSEN